MPYYRRHDGKSETAEQKIPQRKPGGIAYHQRDEDIYKSRTEVMLKHDKSANNTEVEQQRGKAER